MAGDIDHPCGLLSQTQVEAKDESGKVFWIGLLDSEAINEFVTDKAKVLPPRLVLSGVMSLVYGWNFDFLVNWKSAKIPSRFTDGAPSISSKNMEPMASQLIQDGVASLKELEEYYSLEDAFKMFDTILIKGINQALSQEAAMKKGGKK